MTRMEMLIAALTELDRHLEIVNPSGSIESCEKMDIMKQRQQLIDAIIAERDPVAYIYDAGKSVTTSGSTVIKKLCVTCKYDEDENEGNEAPCVKCDDHNNWRAK